MNWKTNEGRIVVKIIILDLEFRWARILFLIQAIFYACRGQIWKFKYSLSRDFHQILKEFVDLIWNSMKQLNTNYFTCILRLLKCHSHEEMNLKKHYLFIKPKNVKNTANWTIKYKLKSSFGGRNRVHGIHLWKYLTYNWDRSPTVGGRHILSLNWAEKVISALLIVKIHEKIKGFG